MPTAAGASEICPTLFKPPSAMPLEVLYTGPLPITLVKNNDGAYVVRVTDFDVLQVLRQHHADLSSVIQKDQIHVSTEEVLSELSGLNWENMDRRRGKPKSSVSVAQRLNYQEKAMIVSTNQQRFDLAKMDFEIYCAALRRNVRLVADEIKERSGLLLELFVDSSGPAKAAGPADFPPPCQAYLTSRVSSIEPANRTRGNRCYHPSSSLLATADPVGVSAQPGLFAGAGGLAGAAPGAAIAAARAGQYASAPFHVCIAAVPIRAVMQGAPGEQPADIAPRRKNVDLDTSRAMQRERDGVGRNGRASEAAIRLEEGPRMLKDDELGDDDASGESDDVSEESQADEDEAGSDEVSVDDDEELTKVERKTLAKRCADLQEEDSVPSDNGAGGPKEEGKRRQPGQAGEEVRGERR